MVATGRRRGRAGFTLIEAVVALTISGALVVMIGALFLTQNEFYSWLMLRSEVQENTRASTELVASEVRSVPRGGVVLAEYQRVVVRSPMVSATVCGVAAMNGYVYVPGGLGSIVQADVASLGKVNLSTGVWTFWDTTWGTIGAAGGTPAATCAANGADTTGATASYLQLNIGAVTGAAPAIGDVFMLGRKTEFKVQASVLDTAVFGLFRGNYGGTLTEIATGVRSDMGFHYRYGSTALTSGPVTGANLALIDGMRISAFSTGRGTSGAKPLYAFGWDVDVPFTNAR